MAGVPVCFCCSLLVIKYQSCAEYRRFFLFLFPSHRITTAVSIADIWQVSASRAKHIDSSLPSRPVPPRLQRLLAAFVCIHRGILPGALSGLVAQCDTTDRYISFAVPVAVKSGSIRWPCRSYRRGYSSYQGRQKEREKKVPKPRRLLLVQGYQGCGLRRSVAWRYRSQNKLRQGLGGLGKPSWQTTT